MHENVILFTDILYFNRIYFLHAMSQKVGARASQVIPDRFKEPLLCFVQEAMNFYQEHDFNINLIDTDLEFDSIKNYTGINMIIVDIDSHIYLYERYTRSRKERVC